MAPPDPALIPLHEWESFYVIIGTSAAALTGLMFVVIAVVADADLTLQRLKREQEKPGG